jgi:copper chaperone
VKAADTSLEDAEARVLYDPQAIDEMRIVTAIEKPGYRVVSAR